MEYFTSWGFIGMYLITEREPMLIYDVHFLFSPNRRVGLYHRTIVTSSVPYSYEDSLIGLTFDQKTLIKYIEIMSPISFKELLLRFNKEEWELFHLQESMGRS